MKAECPHTRPGSPVSPEAAAEVTVEDGLVTAPASWLVLNNFDIDVHFANQTTRWLLTSNYCVTSLFNIDVQIAGHCSWLVLAILSTPLTAAQLATHLLLASQPRSFPVSSRVL